MKCGIHNIVNIRRRRRKKIVYQSRWVISNSVRCVNTDSKIGVCVCVCVCVDSHYIASVESTLLKLHFYGNVNNSSLSRCDLYSQLTENNRENRAQTDSGGIGTSQLTWLYYSHADKADASTPGLEETAPSPGWVWSQIWGLEYNLTSGEKESVKQEPVWCSTNHKKVL